MIIFTTSIISINYQVVGAIYRQNTLFAIAIIFASIFRFASYVVPAMFPQILTAGSSQNFPITNSSKPFVLILEGGKNDAI